MSEARGQSRQPEAEREIPREAVRLPETMYDRSDLTPRGIMYFLIALAFTVVIIHLIMWGYLQYSMGNQVAPAPRNAAVAAPSWQANGKRDPALRFPAPHLQPDEKVDLNKFNTLLDEQLNSYGWVDQKNGVAHIPIERAMDIVSHQGLPARPQPVLPPRANFGSGDGTLAGSGGGTEPKGNQ